jgi:hypothetical protein
MGQAKDPRKNGTTVVLLAFVPFFFARLCDPAHHGAGVGGHHHSTGGSGNPGAGGSAGMNTDAGAGGSGGVNIDAGLPLSDAAHDAAATEARCPGSGTYYIQFVSASNNVDDGSEGTGCLSQQSSSGILTLYTPPFGDPPSIAFATTVRNPAIPDTDLSLPNSVEVTIDDSGPLRHVSWSQCEECVSPPPRLFGVIDWSVDFDIDPATQHITNFHYEYAQKQVEDGPTVSSFIEYFTDFVGNGWQDCDATRASPPALKLPDQGAACVEPPPTRGL